MSLCSVVAHLCSPSLGGVMAVYHGFRMVRLHHVKCGEDLQQLTNNLLMLTRCFTDTLKWDKLPPSSYRNTGLYTRYLIWFLLHEWYLPLTGALICWQGINRNQEGVLAASQIVPVLDAGLRGSSLCRMLMPWCEMETLQWGLLYSHTLYVLERVVFTLDIYMYLHSCPGLPTFVSHYPSHSLVWL